MMLPPLFLLLNGFIAYRLLTRAAQFGGLIAYRLLTCAAQFRGRSLLSLEGFDDAVDVEDAAAPGAAAKPLQGSPESRVVGQVGVRR